MQIKHKLCWIVFLSLSFIFGFSCNHQNQNKEAMDSTNYLTTLVDSSIKPGYDFNKFSTGNWLKEIQYLKMNRPGVFFKSFLQKSWAGFEK